MKKIIFLLALSIQTTFVFANGKNTAHAHYENVKMYRQPSTSTEIVKSLKSSDELVVVRKFNNYWSIVTVDGVVGYVLTSKIAQPKVKNRAAIAKR